MTAAKPKPDNQPGAAESASGETRRGLPEVIYLPDQRPRAKKASGSQKRRRRHREYFCTDDAEHEALHAKVRASGKSLGAYMMQLAEIDATKEARSRRRSHPGIDGIALREAVIAFNRQQSNYNQNTRALNTLVMVVAERSNRELTEAFHALRRELEQMQPGFAAALAAIHAALWHDSEG